ncbi:MAG: ABC transporter permease [Acidobacteria bacterium]|nr:ABC transporter permease [Acidobacteriota bacterium]
MTAQQRSAVLESPRSAEQFDLWIEAGRAEKNYWRDLWRYRELFYFLAWRDILVRYKQTVIGVAWALVRPFLTMVVFTLVFNKVARLPAPGATPYPLLVFAAMLPWQFFSTALTESSNSLIGNANLISKVYFPRLIVPASSVITSLVDFLITLGLMAVMMVWYGFMPDWRLATLPFFMALAFGAAFGAGLWLCALNVKYRDFRYIVPFIVQLGLYVSPVGFSSDLVPPSWRMLYACNPMVGVIDGFRWAMLGGETPIYWPGLLASTLFNFAFCAYGIWYFRRVERTFADVI